MELELEFEFCATHGSNNEVDRDCGGCSPLVLLCRCCFRVTQQTSTCPVSRPVIDLGRPFLWRMRMMMLDFRTHKRTTPPCHHCDSPRYLWNDDCVWDQDTLCFDIDVFFQAPFQYHILRCAVLCCVVPLTVLT